MNNGAKKGGDAETWPVLRAAPGLEDIWQSHFSLAGGKEKNPPDDFIANLEPVDCQGKWVKLSAASDGVFTVTNSRNGFSKTYRPAPSSINLANDKIDFTASLNGGTLARIVLASDPAKLSPLAAMATSCAWMVSGPSLAKRRRPACRSTARLPSSSGR